MPLNPQALSTTAVKTFGDEFDSLSLYDGATGTWETTYPFGDRAGNGGSLNDEQEWYINSRFAPTSAVRPWTVVGSILSLTADRAPAGIQPLINGYKYTSGLLTTYKSFSQLYGYFECRAKLPKGQGLWPAFWMGQQGTYDWPATGTWPPEIDILEVLGKDTTILYTTVHTSPANTALGKATVVSDMSLGFHSYAVGWWQDFTIFYFDSSEIFRVPTPSDCHKPMYLLMNLALGGGWGGAVDATTPFPARFQVDYVRAYRSMDGSVLALPTGPAPAPVPVPVPVPAPATQVAVTLHQFLGASPASTADKITALRAEL